MHYKRLSKEPIVECPVFRCACKMGGCEAFELRTVEKPVLGKKVEKVIKEQLKYCTFFDLEILDEKEK